MNQRVAVILTNYNMPERTDALCEHLTKWAKWPHALFVVDNGSDMSGLPVSKFTTLGLGTNRQTTGGWLAGLNQARACGDWLGYLFLITSAEFLPETDPLSPLAALLDDPEVVGAHPALSADSTSDWPHLFTPDETFTGSRQTWHLDNICALYRAEWFDGMGGFDPCLTFAWGVDLETSWKARRDRKKLLVHDGVQVKKTTNIGYHMGRMRMSADERRDRAGNEMRRVLGHTYGPDWWERLTGEFITAEMALPEPYRHLERISAWN